MIWVHAGLILIWVILILWNYEELQITKGIKEIATKLKEKEREWYNKTMLLYEKASKHHDEAAKELRECRKLKEELEEKKKLMEKNVERLERIGGIRNVYFKERGKGKAVAASRLSGAKEGFKSRKRKRCG